MRIRLSLLIIILTLFSFAGSSLAQERTPATVTVLSTDGSAFPEVRTTVRVQDASGQAVSGLNANHFTVSENYVQPLTVSARDDTLTTVFIINSVPNSVDEKQLFVDIVNQYGATVHRSGDVLAYTFTANSEVREVSSAGELVSIIQSSDFRDEGDITRAFDLTYQFLQSRMATQPVQAIFMGSYVENRSIQYNYPDLPLHVIHATQTRPQYSPNFQALATGQFLPIQTPNDANLNAFLTGINQNRVIYDIEYSSRTAQEGMRNVTLIVNANGSTASGILNFEANVVAPSVVISSTESSAFRLDRTPQLVATPSATSPAEYHSGKLSEVITVTYGFPDGRERTIEQAWLIVNGNIQPSIIPAFNGNTFTIQWDLTGLDTSQTVNIAVGIQDYFGLQATSATQAYEITVGDFVAPTIEVNPCLNADGTIKATTECAVAENTGITIGIVVAQIVALLGLAGFAIWQHQRIGSIAGGAIRSGTQLASNFARGAADIGRKTTIAFTNYASGRSTSVEGTNYENNQTSYMNDSSSSVSSYTPPSKRHQATQIESTLSGATLIESSVMEEVPPNALAIFVVEKGKALTRTIIMRDNMNKISFGREEEYGVDSEGIVPMDGVSRLHCSVYYNHNNRSFTIEDEKSANGTFVNNERLNASVPQPLPPNAIIKLGKNFAMRFVPNAQYQSAQSVSPAADFTAKKTGKLTLIEEDDAAPSASNPAPKIKAASQNGYDANPKPMPPGDRRKAAADDDDNWLD
jgi:hypothetical protein